MYTLFRPHPRRSDIGTKFDCYCYYKHYRGAIHKVSRRTYNFHFSQCREQGIPFTYEEAIHINARLWDIDQPGVIRGDTNNQYRDDTEDISNEDLVVRPCVINNLDNVSDEDMPYIEDFMPEFSNQFAGMTDEQQNAATAHYHDISIEKYKAFFGTPRDRIRSIRKVIHREHGVDIGNPLEQSRRYMKEIVGSKITAIWFDCCINGCMAYTGPWEMHSTCQYCACTRYADSGRSLSRWQYIPLIPRLRIQYGDAVRSRQLKTYRSTFQPADTRRNRNDIFDGDWFKECYETGRFRDPRHLALRISLDGIGLVKNPRRHQSITPVVVYILNLHPAVRDCQENALASLVIPGTFEEKYIDTWLQPLIEELQQLERGVDNVFDGDTREGFCLRAHPILVTGDGKAIAQVMGVKHPGSSKKACRMCNHTGTKDSAGKYYYPHGNDLNVQSTTNLADAINEIHRMKTTLSANEYKELRRDTGINRRSALLDCPTIHFPRSFPIDTMHCISHNIPKHMFQLWKGEKFLDQSFPWVISPKQWKMIDKGLAESRPHIPTSVGTAPRNTGTSNNWTSSEYRTFFLTYGAPAINASLPQEYRSNFLRFRQLLRIVGQPNFDTDDIAIVERLAISFVAQFEQIYMQRRVERIKVCTIQIHSLLHLAGNIRDFGSPIYYAQWSLERFLRRIKGLATSSSLKYISLTTNLLNTERLNHLDWAAQRGKNHDFPSDKATPHAELYRPCGHSLTTRWQRKVDAVRYNQPHTDIRATAAEMVVYSQCKLPNGVVVDTIEASVNNSNNQRCKAYIMYKIPDRPLAFGAVLHFLDEPDHKAQWAGVLRWSGSPAPGLANTTPRPRACKDIRTQPKDHGEHDIEWIPISAIVDVIGIAKAYRPRGNSILLDTYIVDKDGVLEEPA